MKKLEILKQKKDAVILKGKEIWEKNKVFVGIIGGVILHEAVRRALGRAGDYDNPSKTICYLRAGSGDRFAVDEKTEYYNRFGKLVDIKYCNYTEEQAEGYIESLQNSLADWRDAHKKEIEE